MKIRGPIATIGAAAVFGGGLWLANVTQQPAASPPQRAAVVAPASTPPAAADLAPTAPAPPPPSGFPAHADYVGKIGIVRGAITLDITVDGNNAIGYACDGNSIEVWLTGTAGNGLVSLENKAGTGRLEGRLGGDTITGTLSIDQKAWDFTAAFAPAPAGLYVYEAGGTRTSWIIDQNNSVTGVQRRPDGSTSPAPALHPAATRVGGDGDVG